MARKLNGYDIAYTHRGSWTANLSYRGRLLETIPVAWTRDYATPMLTVWFKDVDEAARRLAEGVPFKVALSRREDGGASVQNIVNLFLVFPQEVGETDGRPRSRLICRVDSKVTFDGEAFSRSTSHLPA
ncbi:hypothetical protein [Rhizobium herbae]